MSVREPVNILLVDDQPAKLLSYEVILGELGENLIKANYGQRGAGCPAEDRRRRRARRRVHARSRRLPAGRDDPRASALREDGDHFHLGHPGDRPRPHQGLQVGRRRLCAGAGRSRKSCAPRCASSPSCTARTGSSRSWRRTWSGASPSGPASSRGRTARLQESEERLRQALTAASMGTWRRNLDTQVSQRDANFNAIMGLPAVDSTTSVKERLEEIHPEDREAAADAWTQAVQAQGVYEAEFRIKRRDGAIRWVRDQGRFVAGRERPAKLPRRPDARHHRAQEGRRGADAAHPGAQSPRQEHADDGAGDRAAEPQRAARRGKGAFPVAHPRAGDMSQPAHALELGGRATARYPRQHVRPASQPAGGGAYLAVGPGHAAVVARCAVGDAGAARAGHQRRQARRFRQQRRAASSFHGRSSRPRRRRSCIWRGARRAGRR